AFTQTAQVRSVGGARAPEAWSARGYEPYAGGQVHGTTGTYPATPPLRIRQVVRPAAWPVRVLVWLTVILLVVAGIGLATAHFRPSWMRALHLARVPHTAHAAAGHVAAGPGPTSTTTPSAVTTGAPGAAGTPVTVDTDQYTVLVETTAPCWVLASAPNGSTPILDATLPAGTKQVITPVNGQVSVELGASGVAVQVQIKGKTVSGWSFVPSSAPVTLLFSGTPSA
ncbi:MAG TPA: hypothetical protein VEI83_06515, partial [Acidimicrobiales bacterium]|nr:hypothetical protein [Acidimicrobiales bacterium]